MNQRTTPPVPTSVSEEAQRFLATPMGREARPGPALDDIDGWLEVVKSGDDFLLERFGSIEFPVHCQDTEIAGVHTYVLHADDVRDDPSTPIYLDIHGGALIIGGGDACRYMGSGTAMFTGILSWAVDYRMPPLISAPPWMSR